MDTETSRNEPVPITDDELQPLVAASYSSLADRLEALPPSGWDAPSLCEGWRVREVVAHMTMPVRYDEEAFTAELRDCEFDFTRLSNRIADRDADFPVDTLISQLRDDDLHHWTPRGRYEDALNHVVVHSLDITVPLGESRRSSDEAITHVLEGLTEGGAHTFFGTDLAGRRLEASDLDWHHGSGERLRARAEDLVLCICGRQVPPERLEGAPLSPGGSDPGSQP